MNFRWIKRSMPRSLYGRAALILIVPVAVLVLAVSLVFFQRHFEDVTQQLTHGISLEFREVIRQINAAPDMAAGLAAVRQTARTMGITVAPAAEAATGDARAFYDVSGRIVMDTLRGGVDGVLSVDLLTSSRRVDVEVETRHGPVSLSVDRRRASASNPHQLVVLMLAIAALMTAIAYLYLRNQLRPITRLAGAAEAFGKGQIAPYRPSGAQEVRAAGRAFLDMRARIERQIEQRTMMLSGVSHDLRTPLTRLKLSLSLIPPGPDVDEMERDVSEMERLIGAFLDFARSDQLDDPESVIPADIARKVAEDATRGGCAVEVVLGDGSEDPVILRGLAVERALTNLVGNALRYGRRARLTVSTTPRLVVFSVEDDGPGIPEDRRDEALKPFARLDTARNQDKGSGVGLGLAIARDIARRHGGKLRLDSSAALGGLRAELSVAR
ncbi:ATP-binding protein [Tropicimonas sp.]|uniref:ATP-binding protein n=1 Tax=Tropicimonas sp. TaxID=2067044 RepID=UPI003A86C9E9